MRMIMPKNVICKKCNNLVNGWCEKVIDRPDPDMKRDCRHFREKTNADRIRAMSDEEMAKLIAENAYTGACNDFGIPHQDQCCHNCERCDAIIKWLKQPAE